MIHFAESPTYHLSRLFWIAISFYRSLSLFPVVCASQCLSCFVSVRRVNIAFSRIVWRRTDQRAQQCCIRSEYWYFSCRDGSFRKFRFVKFLALHSITLLTFPQMLFRKLCPFQTFFLLLPSFFPYNMSNITLPIRNIITRVTWVVITMGTAPLSNASCRFCFVAISPIYSSLWTNYVVITSCQADSDAGVRRCCRGK